MRLPFPPRRFRKQKAQRSEMAHTLQAPIFDDTFGTDVPLVKYACSCGSWRRIFRENMAPNLQEVESDHESHRQRAGAEEIRTGGKLKSENPLEEVLRAMAAVAAESTRASEAIQEFVSAHTEANGRGMGVVVVRKADGTTTSTPNVFVPKGTAIFMDEPALFVPSGPLEMIPDDILIQRDQVYEPRIPAARIIETGLAA